MPAVTTETKYMATNYAVFLLFSLVERKTGHAEYNWLTDPAHLHTALVFEVIVLAHTLSKS